LVSTPGFNYLGNPVFRDHFEVQMVGIGNFQDFASAIKAYQEKLEKSSQLSMQITSIFRKDIDDHFAKKQNADGSAWRPRQLRDGRQYWRSRLSHALLDTKGYQPEGFNRYGSDESNNNPSELRKGLSIKMQIQYPKIIFMVIPSDLVRPFAYIHNYGGSSRNKYSDDGRTVQPKRQFGYLSQQAIEQMKTKIVERAFLLLKKDTKI